MLLGVGVVGTFQLRGAAVAVFCCPTATGGYVSILRSLFLFARDGDFVWVSLIRSV